MSTISPLHFGPSDAPLFGTYHAPASPRASSPAVVVCAPFGTEYLLSHALLRRTAEVLAREGYHVLRFDWTGSGDSAGDAAHVDLDQWSRDLEAAVDEVRDMSGASKIVALGVGLGASVAIRTAASNRGIRHVVAWEPVLIGARYLAWLANVARNPAVREPTAPDPVGVLGVPMPAPFRQRIAAMDLAPEVATLGPRLTIVARREAMPEAPGDHPERRVVLPDDTDTMERALRTGNLMLEQRVLEALVLAVREAMPC